MKDLVKLYFDGAAEPNPGFGGYGYIVEIDSKEIHKFGMSTGNPTTNNEAEHLGLLHGLTWLYENGYTNHSVLVLGDSQLVINQVFGHWKCKADNLKLLVRMNKNLVSQFRNIKSEWIAGETNPADKYSRMFL